MANWLAPSKNPLKGDMIFDPVRNMHLVYDGFDWIPHPTNSGLYYTDSTSSIRLNTSTAAPTATNTFEVNTPSGTIRANMATGDVEFPRGMHRSVAIWEFWNEFSKVYKPVNIELDYAKQEIAMLKQKTKEYENYAVKEITEKIAEKIQKKYGNEKFIMTKPDDLIKFIKDEI